MFSYSSKHRGFTLIELLTVIAIIGILAAILVPVVGKVRDSARASVCSSNIRQLAIAMVVYASENGRMPAAASNLNPSREEDWIHWRREWDIRDSVIAPYVGGTVDEDLFRCPSDEGAATRPRYRYSYSMNSFVAGNSSRLSNSSINGNLDAIRDPSLIVMLAEEDNPDDGHFAPGNTLATRHDGRGHVAFCDGSVQLLSWRQDFLDSRGGVRRERLDPLHQPAGR